MKRSDANGSATIGTTEYFLASNSTTKTNQTEDCELQPWIDFGAMVAGDQYSVKLYEAVNGGTQRSYVIAVLTGTQAFPWVGPTLKLGDSWEISVKKIAGTDRSIGWSLRKLIDGLGTQDKADVNTEAVDVLNVDTYAEPGQANPAATASLVSKIGYLYKAWRNKKTQTSTTWSLYADDTTTVDQKSTVSDDGTTATRGEVATGP